jgi:hypothetical protein
VTKQIKQIATINIRDKRKREQAIAEFEPSFFKEAAKIILNIPSRICESLDREVSDHKDYKLYKKLMEE